MNSVMGQEAKTCLVDIIKLVKKMRDPDRIDPIMTKFTELWKLHPNWRLCQLLSNVAKEIDWEQNDLFYLEDGDLLRGLRKLRKI